MRKINWEIVFINNIDNFSVFLNTNYFAELSQLSKLIRSKFKSKLFSNIIINDNIYEDICGEVSKSNKKLNNFDVLINKLPIDEYITIFNRCFRRFVPYINRVDLKTHSNHYQLLEVSNLITNLTSLSIYNTLISLTAFNKALSTLKCLKKLRVDSVNFIIYNGENYPINSVGLPNSLIDITWEYNTVLACDLNYDPQTTDNSVYYPSLLNSNPIFILADYFPKLKNFTSFSLPISFYNKLVLKNPHLTQFVFKIKEFNINSAQILSNIQNIEKLELLIDSLNYRLNTIEWHFPSLTSLKFHHVKSEIWPILEKIVLSSPALTELKFYLSFSTAPSLTELINNSPYLQRLTVESANYIQFNIEELNPHPNLRYLEIWFEIDINSLLLKLSESPNFKMVCIKSHYVSSDSSLLILDQDCLHNSWKLVKFDKCYKYYRLSK